MKSLPNSLVMKGTKMVRLVFDKYIKDEEQLKKVQERVALLASSVVAGNTGISTLQYGPNTVCGGTPFHTSEIERINSELTVFTRFLNRLKEYNDLMEEPCTR